MLRIRLTRIGKTNRPIYRIVVAEHSAPIKGKFIEILGHYNPLVNPKALDISEEKIKGWIAKGAKPSDTVAVLLKSKGMQDMDKYIAPRNKKHRKKGEQPAETVAPQAAAPAAPAAPAPTAPVEAK